MGIREPTPAQRYRDAVWETEQLTTTEKLVALAYADHCRNGGEVAWVARRRLMARCTIRSEHTVVRVRASLIAKGWLAPDGTSQRHRQVTVYRLTIPETGALSAPVRHPKPVHSAPKPVHSGTETGALSAPDGCTGDTPPSGEDPQSDPPPDSPGAQPPAAPEHRDNNNTARSPEAEAALAELRSRLQRGHIGKPGRIGRTPGPGTVDDTYDPATAQRLAELAEEADPGDTRP